MPFTPLHIPVAFATWLLTKKKIPLAPLVLANMAPDLEVPVIYSLSYMGLIRVNDMIVDRLVLHSILGGILLVPLVMMVVYPVYSWILSYLRIHCPKISPRDMFLVGSIGGLSHVLLDAVHHPYNPLLFPLTYRTVNNLVVGDYRITSIIVHMVFAIILLVIFLYGYMKFRSLRGALGFTLGCTQKYL